MEPRHKRDSRLTPGVTSQNRSSSQLNVRSSDTASASRTPTTNPDSSSRGKGDCVHWAHGPGGDPAPLTAVAADAFLDSLVALRCACGHLAYDHAQAGCFAVVGDIECECRVSHATLVGNESRASGQAPSVGVHTPNPTETSGNAAISASRATTAASTRGNLSPSTAGEAGAVPSLPSSPSSAAFYEVELGIEADQFPARVQAAAGEARRELELVEAALRTHRPDVRIGVKRARRTRLLAAGMVAARLRWLFSKALLVVVLVALLFACGDNLCGEVTLVDAAPAPAVDAAPPVCTFDDVQRSEECKVICFQDWMRCAGATGDACYDECRAFQTGTAYCPPMGGL